MNTTIIITIKVISVVLLVKKFVAIIKIGGP